MVRQRDYFRPALQTLFAFLRTPALAVRAAKMGGYDVAATGQVRYAR